VNSISLSLWVAVTYSLASKKRVQPAVKYPWLKNTNTDTSQRGGSTIMLHTVKSVDWWHYVRVGVALAAFAMASIIPSWIAKCSLLYRLHGHMGTFH